MTDLEAQIQQTPLADTHEHLYSESHYVENGPDILQDLFDRLYITADLVVAGASPRAVGTLLDAGNPDLEERWAGVAAAWEHCRHTGFGEAVLHTARRVYGIDEITSASLRIAHLSRASSHQPGDRLRILKQEANLDHVQIDDKTWACRPDPSGPDFFLYDISWYLLSNGEIEFLKLHQETGVEVHDLPSLRRAMETLFEKYAHYAVAVKSQHAYRRTLRWEQANEHDVAKILERILAGREIADHQRVMLGDWCLERGVELSIRHRLPFKIHTGYNARFGEMLVDRIRPGLLTQLLQRFPEARFVLMHLGYPYADEMIALAKHYPNVSVDMCWSWSIDPLAAVGFLRRALHTIPVNKIFVFGGDTFWPNAAASYAAQTRIWLNRALAAEITDGLVTETEARKIADRIMLSNQREFFAIDEKLRAIAGR